MKYSVTYKKLISLLLAVSLFAIPVSAAEDYALDAADVDAAVFDDSVTAAGESALDISAPSAVLMEAQTGEIIYEKDADCRLPPASVTKIMTILLIVEAVESGAVSKDDTVSVSAYAASMGGSQVFLSEGEEMSVEELLKCVVVSSANDAAVALAEHIAGTEGAFVSQMNERAAQLEMTDTHFSNCTGLPTDGEHLTTAADIAKMSRELISHDWIKEYTTIWMDTIRNGEFGLSNTNKLIYYYDGATGLKTGYTADAGYCLSATAERDGTSLIAVCMNCDTSAHRFESAKTLLSYGFANYTAIPIVPDGALPPVAVSLGKEAYIQPEVGETKYYLADKRTAGELTLRVELAEKLTAPVDKTQTVGRVVIACGDEILAENEIIAAEQVEKLSFRDMFTRFLALIFAGID